jgi:hypothetical protein
VARRSADNIATYSTRRHAQILAEHGFDEEQVVKELETTTSPEALSKLLYPDAHDFLKKLKSFGEPMVLLSLGDSEFQMLKVQGSGIEAYFDRVFVVNDTKEHVVAELLAYVKDKKIWFVNDWVQQTLEIKNKFPQLHYILKQSPEGGSDEQYAKSGLPYFKTLTQIYEYIASKQ